MSAPLTWAEVDDEQVWESDKYTVADELMYQSGVDVAPDKPKSADQLYMEHVEKIENSSTASAQVNRVALMSQYMTEEEIEQGRMVGVDTRALKTGQTDIFETRRQHKSINTHGERVRSFEETEADDGSDSDDLFADDDEDTAAQLEAIRRQRLLEIKQSSTHGSVSSGPVMEVSPEQFDSEVKVASNQGEVLMLIYKDNSSACDIMLGLLQTLARKYPTLKYTKMKASAQIRNFPLEDCPTLMCYHRGKVVGQFVKLDAFNGSKTTALDLEWRLAESGILDSDLTENPRDAALFY